MSPLRQAHERGRIGRNCQVKAPPLSNPAGAVRPTLSSPSDPEPPGCSKEVWEAEQKGRLTAGREPAAGGTEAECLALRAPVGALPDLLILGGPYTQPHMKTTQFLPK